MIVARWCEVAATGYFQYPAVPGGPLLRRLGGFLWALLVPLSSITSPDNRSRGASPSVIMVRDRSHQDSHPSADLRTSPGSSVNGSVLCGV